MSEVTLIEAIENHVGFEVSPKSLPRLQERFDLRSARQLCVELHRFLQSRPISGISEESSSPTISAFWFPDRATYVDQQHVSVGFATLVQPSQGVDRLTQTEKQTEDRQLKNLLLYYDRVVMPIELPIDNEIETESSFPYPSDAVDRHIDDEAVVPWANALLDGLVEKKELVVAGVLDHVWKRRLDRESYAHLLGDDIPGMGKMSDRARHEANFVMTALEKSELLRDHVAQGEHTYFPATAYLDWRVLADYTQYLSMNLTVPSARLGEVFQEVLRFHEEKAKLVSSDIRSLSAHMLEQADLPGLEALSWHDIVAVRTDGETFSQWRSDIEDVLSYAYANRNLYADVGRETVEYAQTKLRPSLQRLSREVARSKLLSGAKTSSIFFALGALIATAASGGDPAVGALGGLSSALGPLFQMAKRIPQRDDSVALLNHYYVFYPKN